jgi:hypothetical protein
MMISRSGRSRAALSLIAIVSSSCHRQQFSGDGSLTDWGFWSWCARYEVHFQPELRLSSAPEEHRITEQDGHAIKLWKPECLGLEFDPSHSYELNVKIAGVALQPSNLRLVAHLSGGGWDYP